MREPARDDVVLPFKKAPPENAEIQRLAGLPWDEYEQERKAAATRMNVRSSALDKSVKAARARMRADGGRAPDQRLPFTDAQPWETSVVPADVLDDALALAARHVVADKETLWAAVLWCALTWFVLVATVLPIALITSPEKNSGKSTLLEVIQRLTRRALLVSNISPAALFRCIEAWSPTLMIDECDSFAKDNEELRGILNSGHTRETAQVVRAVEVNGDFEPRVFSTFAPMALAGIGHLPATIESRSITLPMRRKKPGETAERLRHADRAPFEVVRRQFARWAEDQAYVFASLHPTLPGLSNRDADNWEPLLALADMAGGVWPERAREAARKLTGSHDAATVNEELLACIRAIFVERQVDKLTSEAVLEALADDPTGPWATWNKGRPMTPRQLSQRLSSFGIAPKSIRVGPRTPKGYELEQFEDAFARYLATPPDLAATPQQRKRGGPSSDFSAATRANHVVAEKTLEALRNEACCGVADETGGEWEEEP